MSEDIINLEQYWNDKHPKQKVVYQGRALPTVCPTCKQHNIIHGVPLDVKNFVIANDILLQEVIEKYQLKAPTNDETMLRIQKFVVSNIKYVSDDSSIGCPEYWQFPFETLYGKCGDCEDGAILIASLALNAGVPVFRIRVVAGLVKPDINAPEGGHGYNNYLRESDQQWVICDWCYYQDSHISVEQKPIAKNNDKYKEVWFSFNNLYSWGNKEFEISGRVKLKSI